MSRSIHFGLLLLVILFAALPTLAAPISLSGRVVDVKGVPLTEVRITLRPAEDLAAWAKRTLGDKPSPTPSAEARSDSSGFYRITAPQVGLWQVLLEAPGLAIVESAPIPLVEETTLPDAVLEPDSSALVFVQTADKHPVAGALVVARAYYKPGIRQEDFWKTPVQSVRTAPDGTCRISRFDKSRLTIGAGIPGSVMAELEAVHQSKITLTLPAGMGLPCIVNDERGRPVADVIALLGVSRWPLSATPANGVITPVLAEGRATPVLLAAPDGRILALPLTPSAPPPDSPQKPRPLVLADLTSQEGRVISLRTRQPIAGALVQSAQQPTAFQATGADGRFALRLPVSAQGMISAWAADFLSGSTPHGRLEQPTGSSFTIALKPAAAVTGVVVDDRGVGIPGVRISSEEQQSHGGNMRFTIGGGGLKNETHSGPGGVFRLGRLDPELSWLLRAQANRRDLAPGSLELPALLPGQTRAGIRIVLAPGRSINGKIVDQQGNPLEGVSISAVKALDPGQQHMPFMGGPKAPVGAALSGTDGLFSIQQLEPGTYDLTASRHGFASGKIPGVNLQNPAGNADAGTLTLQPGARISGRVQDKDGNPLEDAAIRLVPADPFAAMSVRFGSSPPNAETGPDGWFTIEDLTPGEAVELMIQKSGYADLTQSGVQVPTPQDLTISLQPSSTISGQILDSDGKPIPRVQLTLYQTSAAGRGGMSVAVIMGHDKGQTDAEGKFLIEDVAPGTYRLVLSAEGFQGKSKEGLEVAAGHDLTDLSITLDRAARLEGRALSADGLPVVGADISIVEGSGGFDFSSPRAKTDGDGYYRLDGLAPGLHSFQARHQEYPRAVRDIEVKSGNNKVDFNFPGGQEVSGRVVDETGSPVVGASLVLGNPTRFFSGADVVSAADGSFRFSNVNNGEYQVSANRTGFYRPGDPPTIKVNNAPVSGVLVQLNPGGKITGKLVGLEPKDYPETLIHAFCSTEAPPSFGRADFRGNYEVSGLPPGNCDIQAEAGQTGRFAKGTIQLAKGQSVAELDLVFGGGYRISGRVFLGEQPLTNLPLTVSGSGSSISTRTDNDGHFQVEGLQKGDYNLDIRSWERGLSHSERVTLEGDRELTIRLPTAVVKGRVIDSATRNPLSGVQVSLKTFSDQPSLFGDFFSTRATSTDDSGRFKLSNIPEGSFRLLTRKEGFAAKDTSVMVSANQDPDEIEIALEATGGMILDLRTASGQYPEDVQVLVLDAAGRSLISGHFSTGENGRLRLSSVPPGNWELLIKTDNSGSLRLQVTAPSGPQPVLLPPPCTLHIRVDDLAQFTGKASVRLFGADGRVFRTMAYWGQLTDTWTLSQGAAHLTELPPGSWTVEVKTDDGRVFRGTANTLPGAPAQVNL